MENYFIPQNIGIQNMGEFFITWSGENYRIFDGCPDRSTTKIYKYHEISPWGFVVDKGEISIPQTADLSVGPNCSVSDNNIQTIFESDSIFDAPNFSPYEPIYFLGFLALAIFLFASAFKLVFGGKR